MKKQEFHIFTPLIKNNAIELIKQIEPKDKNPIVVTVQKSTRKLSQNRLLWVLLAKVSKQQLWPVSYPDGSVRSEILTDYEWKDIFSASLQGDGRKVQDPNSNSMVLLGCSTRRETVEWFSDMIELIYAFGAQQGINLD